jgi:hypothetical protein
VNAEFEVKVTYFVDRQGTVRQKLVDFTLHRKKGEGTVVTYSTLTVDISKYFRSTSIIDDVYVMDSYRTAHPELTMCFVVIGNYRSGGDVSEYYEERATPAILEDDLEADGNDAIEHPMDKSDDGAEEPCREEKGNGPPEGPGKAPPDKGAPAADADLAPKEQGHGHEEPPQQKQHDTRRRGSEDEMDRDREGGTPIAMGEHEPPKRPPVIEEEEEESPEAKGNLDPPPAPRTEREDKSPPPQARPSEEPSLRSVPTAGRVSLTRSDGQTPMSGAPGLPARETPPDPAVMTVLKRVFTRRWDHLAIEDCPFIDDDQTYRLPVAIYPIMTAIITSKLLESNMTDEVFNLTLAAFWKLFERGEIHRGTSPEEYFLELLLLEPIIRVHFAGYSNHNRVQKFVDGFTRRIQENMESYLSKMLMIFEVTGNRLISADVTRFDSDTFLEDFMTIWGGMESSIHFPAAFSRFLLRAFSTRLDARFVNKMLMNPDAFMMGHVIAWNSFTGAAQEAGFSFPLFFQLARGFMVLGQMTPKLFREVCPDVPPLCILYCMQNWKIDRFMEDSVEWAAFAKAHKVTEPVERPHVEPVPFPPWSAEDAGWKLDAWQNVQIQPQLLRANSIFRMALT